MKLQNEHDHMVYREALGLIEGIADRGIKMRLDYDGVLLRKADVMFSLIVTHANKPLRLQEFLDADDGDFGHDFFGILKYLDPDTGEMTDCFVPRFTA